VVEAVPGPDNRIDGQLPMTAQFSLDWGMSGVPLRWSASLAVQGRARTRVSAPESTESNRRSVLDVAALWTLSPRVQVRLAAANLLRPHELSTNRYEDNTGQLVQFTDAPKDVTWRLGVDWRL
jgi:hypothetical protein